jgi:hypothetical protein
MAFVEPRAAFLDPNGFADAVVWNGTTTIYGIFDAVVRDAFGNMVEGYGPSLMVDVDTVPGVQHADTFTVRGKSYIVTQVDDDQSGFLVLHLRLAQ